MLERDSRAWGPYGGGDDDFTRLPQAPRQSLDDMVAQLLGLLDLDHIAAQAATDLSKIFPGDLICVTTADDSTHLIIRGAGGQRHGAALEGVELPVGSLGMSAVRRGERLIVPNYDCVPATPEFRDLLVREEGVRAAVSVPLFCLGQPVGTVFVGRRDPSAFADSELDLIQDTARVLAPLVRKSLEATRRTKVARSAERNQIATELHDEVIPLLFLLRSTIDTLAESPDAQAPTVQTALAEVSDLASTINSLVRQTLRSVAPVPADLELSMRVRAAVDRLATQFRFRADVVEFGPATPVPARVAELLVSVVHEALANVAKHAPGASVVVTLSYQVRSVSLTIQDDGPGPPPGFHLAAPAAPQAGDQFGLINLAWRLSAAAGTLSLETNDDGGTTIRADVPLEPSS